MWNLYVIYTLIHAVQDSNGSIRISKLHCPLGPNPRINIVGLSEAASVTSWADGGMSGKGQGNESEEGEKNKETHRIPQKS